MDTHGRDEYLFKLRLTEVEFDYPLPQKKNHKRKTTTLNNRKKEEMERKDKSKIYFYYEIFNQPLWFGFSI